MLMRIAGLPNETDRAVCEARLVNLEEHVDLSARAYAIAEARYVDKHVEPFPELRPELVPDSRTYEQRVEDAKAGFAQSERGIELQTMRDERRDKLWQNLETFVDSFTPEKADRDEPDQSVEIDKTTDRLNVTFERMTRH